ncbi:MAG: ATP-binding cassette domain-containing protein [Oscillospiraceae bacterium]|jgi:putative ABC transport system ATP-binding protein|nr:ATP-binding cassette domain-containing protein [Oscillospiraceae bacterium]
MLILSNIDRTFNKATVNEKKALVDISLRLDPGDFVTVIGGNGAGKSTLLNLIAGVHRCDRGSVALDGEDITHLPEYRRAKYLGRVFQDPMRGTAGDMNIDENLAMAKRRGSVRTLRWGISRAEREEYREKLGTLGLGLEDRLGTKVGLLSGGQRQALTLIMATLKKPKLLLLDEHTAALDPKTAEIVLRQTNEIVSGKGLTTLMVTHNMSHAIKYGNRIIMMNGGKILFDISGGEKKNLKVEDLLERFKVSQGQELDNDRMLLA